ncbi:MAG: hypothetical protein IJJ25_04605 [Lachnospiraceae bacterium]|nr:hypothetical protein [Lachnospiraceae bacterium]
MAQFLEVIMLVCFGFSWPMNIIKSLQVRSAKGKSLPFLCLIMLGYVAGLGSKIISGNITYVVFFYILNLVMVFADFCLYWRNRALDAARENTDR